MPSSLVCFTLGRVEDRLISLDMAGRSGSPVPVHIARSGTQLKEDLAAASTVPHEDDVGRGDDHKPRHHASTVGALSERR